MATYLDLRPDCLIEPSRFDVAVIEATMLWPHEPETRARYLAAVIATLAVEMVASVPAGTPAEIRDWARTIREAPSIEEFSDRSKAAFVHGAAAGERLREAIGFRGRKVADIDTALAKRLWRTQRLSTSTLNNTVWPRYRCVAHLWAAYIHLTAETGIECFPTPAADLGLFLAVADEYRSLGETTRSSTKSPSMILRPGEAVLAPPAMALPAVSRTFTVAN